MGVHATPKSFITSYDFGSNDYLPIITEIQSFVLDLLNKIFWILMMNWLSSYANNYCSSILLVCPYSMQGKYLIFFLVINHLNFTLRHLTVDLHKNTSQTCLTCTRIQLLANWRPCSVFVSTIGPGYPSLCNIWPILDRSSTQAVTPTLTMHHQLFTYTYTLLLNQMLMYQFYNFPKVHVHAPFPHTLKFHVVGVRIMIIRTALSELCFTLACTRVWDVTLTNAYVK